ncbi:MAG: DUF2809 domain-containing protein [Gemmatimonas sp.]
MSRLSRVRLTYLALGCATIAVGLTVHWSGDALRADVRDVAGDALWAMMIAWGIGALVPSASLRVRGAVALAICFAVELSQLLHTPMLHAVRSTTVGQLVLGSAFDARDLGAYAFGVLAAVLLESAVTSARRKGIHGLTFLAVCFHTASLGAQSLQGTVVDSASRRPVAGSIVLVLDASGTSVARTVTNTRGQYRVSLPDNATRVRVLHIGFRPSAAVLPPTVSGVARLDVALALLTTVLEAIDVRDNANCAVRRDRAQALALWEQARQGLLAMIVAREAIPAQLKRLRYERLLDGPGNRIVSQEVVVDSTTGATRPFQAARSARDFVQLGFAEDSAGVRSYYAPDADVMLEDAFFMGYCFRVMPEDRSHPGLVGVGFSAAKHRAPNVDIDGAFWMDTSARVLSRIEFRYVGLDPKLDAYRPGGRVEFREMPNGIVSIDRWALRLVAMRVDTVYVVRDPSMRRNRDVVPEERARFEVHESGGELANARWEDGTSWQASLGTLRLDARTHDGGVAIGTDISLEHTNYRGVVDSTGLLVFSDLLPGPYRTIVHDPVLAQIDVTLKTPIEFRAVRDSVHTAMLDVPTAYDYARSLCPPERLPALRPVAFFVYVTTPGGQPVSDLEIKEMLKRPLDVPEWKSTAFGGKTDKSGRYFSCWRFAPDDMVQIWVRQGNNRPQVTLQKMSERVNAVRIVFSPEGR